MKRRTFLKRTAPLITLPLAMNGIRFNTFAQTKELSRLSFAGEENDRVLVIIQLEGGNDGLNTVIPVDDDIYYNSRPGLALQKSTTLPIAGEPLLALHPALAGLQQLFNDERLAIISNIGYDNYSLSHFSGIEIWNTASGNGPQEHQASGWMGRFLQEDFPEYPQDLPDHPPAIQIRSAVSSIFGIGNSTMGLALTDPATFYDLVNGGPAVIGNAAPNTLAGREWNYIQTITTQSIQYSGIIHEAAAKAKNLVDYSGGGVLGESLAIIARLIAGGLKTRVYMVTLGEFDTHGEQLFHHHRQLLQLGSGIHSFMKDLVALGIDDRVVGMTYSEFGRRIRENASGTDHGAAAPHIVFGAPVQGGRVLQGLPDLANPDHLGNLRHTVTFQSYYASVLAPLFELEEKRLQKILPTGLCDINDRLQLYRNWPRTVLPNQEYGTTASLTYFPNPASSETTIGYTVPSPGHVHLILHSISGESITTIVDSHQEAGRYSVRVNLASIPSGIYLCRLHAAGSTQARKIVVQR